MKSLLFFMLTLLLSSNNVWSQNSSKLTVEVSNDSILLGNYIEVKFTVENAEVQDFVAPDFMGFTLVSGPNQSTSMMINNGAVTRSVSYSYYIQPDDIGNYFIQPAYATTKEGDLSSQPIPVMVVPNPDGIIETPQQRSLNNFWGKDDIFGGNDFFNGNDLFREFFDSTPTPFFDQSESNPKEKKALKRKKKRKVYKL